MGVEVRVAGGSLSSVLTPVCACSFLLSLFFKNAQMQVISPFWCVCVWLGIGRGRVWDWGREGVGV